MLSCNLGEGIWMGGSYGLVGLIGTLGRELKGAGAQENPWGKLGRPQGPKKGEPQ